MFKKTKALIDYGRQTFESCMAQPDWNSRFVFLIAGLSASFSMLALVGGFIYRAKTATDYPSMVMAIGGTGAGAALGRFLTKKGAAQPPDQNGN